MTTYRRMSDLALSEGVENAITRALAEATGHKVVSGTEHSLFGEGSTVVPGGVRYWGRPLWLGAKWQLVRIADGVYDRDNTPYLLITGREDLVRVVRDYLDPLAEVMGLEFKRERV